MQDWKADHLQAVQRDLKNYIKNHADRTIPVGYSAADVRDILKDSWAYFQCNNNNDGSASDFFGLNSYSWCGGEATFDSAGYDDLVDMFKDSYIPVFFSEYGCNKIMPRVFNEVQALYGDKMTALSGGLVYEYSKEEADYGLVTINDNNTVSLLTDYDNLQGQFNKLDMALIQATNPSDTNIKQTDCKSDLISNDAFSHNFTIPKPPPGADDIIKNGIENPVQGKIVDVTETKVKQTAYGSNGNEIQNLEITKLANDESNTPNGQTTTTSANNPSESKKGAASKLNGSWTLYFVAILSGALLTMW